MSLLSTVKSFVMPRDGVREEGYLRSILKNRGVHNFTAEQAPLTGKLVALMVISLFDHETAAPIAFHLALISLQQE
jgi:hypothetical protein